MEDVEFSDWMMFQCEGECGKMNVNIKKIYRLEFLRLIMKELRAI